MQGGLLFFSYCCVIKFSIFHIPVIVLCRTSLYNLILQLSIFIFIFKKVFFHREQGLEVQRVYLRRNSYSQSWFPFQNKKLKHCFKGLFIIKYIVETICQRHFTDFLAFGKCRGVRTKMYGTQLWRNLKQFFSVSQKNLLFSFTVVCRPSGYVLIMSMK